MRVCGYDQCQYSYSIPLYINKNVCAHPGAHFVSLYSFFKFLTGCSSTAQPGTPPLRAQPQLGVRLCLTRSVTNTPQSLFGPLSKSGGTVHVSVLASLPGRVVQMHIGVLLPQSWVSTSVLPKDCALHQPIFSKKCPPHTSQLQLAISKVE